MPTVEKVQALVETIAYRIDAKRGASLWVCLMFMDAFLVPKANAIKNSHPFKI